MAKTPHIGLSPEAKPNWVFSLPQPVPIMVSAIVDDTKKSGLKTGFVGTVIGGMVSFPLAVLGAILVGVVESFSSFYASAFKEAIVFALLIPFLLWRGLGRPRLVVLSACETGLYDIDHNPEEFVGLPGAFTALGAAGVHGSLRPVSDHATSLLMANVALTDTMGVARAHRRSQKEDRSASRHRASEYSVLGVPAPAGTGAGLIDAGRTRQRGFQRASPTRLAKLL